MILVLIHLLIIITPSVWPSAENNEAIRCRWASQYGQAEVVKLLLNDPRVDPSNVHLDDALLKNIIAR